MIMVAIAMLLFGAKLPPGGPGASALIKFGVCHARVIDPPPPRDPDRDKARSYDHKLVGEEIIHR
jgi:hypothetical protein